MPRDTLTAPCSLPVSCASGASRTSTTSTLPDFIFSNAWAGESLGTAALASARSSFTLVGMCFLHLQSAPGEYGLRRFPAAGRPIASHVPLCSPSKGGDRVLRSLPNDQADKFPQTALRGNACRDRRLEHGAVAT